MTALEEQALARQRLVLGPSGPSLPRPSSPASDRAAADKLEAQLRRVRRALRDKELPPDKAELLHGVLETLLGPNGVDDIYGMIPPRPREGAASEGPARSLPGPSRGVSGGATSRYKWPGRLTDAPAASMSPSPRAVPVDRPIACKASPPEATWRACAMPVMHRSASSQGQRPTRMLSAERRHLYPGHESTAPGTPRLQRNASLGASVFCSGQTTPRSLLPRPAK
ncbi:unnamed protein product [Polarella glacialis]|nr:unnamed protein product [Polarella glacialis]